MSPSFLKEGQKLLQGSEIIQNKDKSEIIEEQITSIEKYLKHKGISREKIEEYKNIQKLFISKYLGIVVFHTDNWGFIDGER